MLDSKLIANIADKSLLNVLPELKRCFVDNGDVEMFVDGQSVQKEGEPILRFTLLLKGTLALQTNNGESIGHLVPGRSLCLKQFLNDEPAPYAAVAQGSVMTISIPREVVLRLFSMHPHVDRYLRLVSEFRSVRSFRHMLGGMGVEMQEIVEIVSVIRPTPMTVEAGESINPDHLLVYFIEQGEFAVSGKQGNNKIEGTLAEGAWFGGEALVAPHRLSYEVKAKTQARVLVAQAKQLAAAVKREALLEKLYGDPCVKGSTQVFKAFGSAEAGTFSVMPGERIGVEDIERLGISAPLDQLRAATDVRDSLVSSIANLCAIRQLTVNMHGIQSELSGLDRVSPLRVAESLERFGLAVTNLACEFDQIASQQLPALTRYGERFVVLLAARKAAVVLCDPFQGFIAVARKDFEEHWNKQVFEVEEVPTDKIGVNAPKGETATARIDRIKAAIFKNLTSGLRPLRGLLFSRAMMMLLTLFLGTMSPKFTQHLIDEVLTLRDVPTIWLLSIGSAFFVFYRTFIDILGSFSWTHFSTRFDRVASRQFMRHYLSADMKLDPVARVGDIQARSGQLAQIKSFLTDQSFGIVQTIVSAVVYTCFLLQYDWKLAGIAFLVFPITFAVRAINRRILRSKFEVMFENGKLQSSIFGEQIGSIATVKALCAEEPLRRRWERVALDNALMRRGLGYISSGIEGVSGVLCTCVQVACMYFGIKLAIDSKITVGEIIAVNMYVGSLLGPVRSLAGLFDTIEQIKLAMTKVADVFGAPRIDEPSASLGLSWSNLEGKIRMDNVNFRFSNETPWVLQDVSVTIFPRQVVALVGRSGCGKTTLAKVIGRTLAPTSGRIFYDDTDAALLTPACIRAQIGTVMQENQLFAGSVLENIAFGDDAPDENLVARAAGQAGASEFIMRLPNSYQFHLSEGGIGLSGGQKQRISIARTLYLNPRILIMDEATSALDAESESAIIGKMREILDGRTAIIIAHRLSTIRNADRILVMEKGRIVEEGVHDELMANRGYYWDLFREQVAALEA